MAWVFPGTFLVHWPVRVLENRTLPAYKSQVRQAVGCCGQCVLRICSRKLASKGLLSEALSLGKNGCTH